MKRAISCGAWIAVALVMLMAPGVAGAATVTSLPTRDSSSLSERASMAKSVAAPVAATMPERNYAERETRNPQAADFRGGDGFGIYIGGGAALVLAVVLIVLLVR